MTTIIYGRVSTTGQADNGHSLDAQRDQLERYASLHDLGDTHWLADAGVSGRKPPDERPAMRTALAMLADGAADGLVAVSVDRLSRDLVDLLLLARRAVNEGWSLRALDVSVDAGDPDGKLQWGMLGLIAEHKADVIAKNTRAGLAAARAKGVRLGGPVSDATRSAGRRGLELRDQGKTWAAVAAALEAEGYVTAQGKSTWSRSQASRAVRTVELDAQAEAAAADQGGG